jgi:universal stress protein E
MLVKPINWSTHPVVLAAIDTSSDDQAALNERILQRSRHLCELLAGSLHIVSTYPSVDHWVGPVSLAMNFDKVKQSVSREIHDRIANIASTQGLKVAEIHAAEGEPEDAIRSVADQINADLTVMGTVQRAGPQGAFIGNTSEKILHRLHSDVEVLR